jgi:hypothetical protein
MAFCASTARSAAFCTNALRLANDFVALFPSCFVCSTAAVQALTKKARRAQPYREIGVMGLYLLGTGEA